ncbi:MAG TPA: tetratricopeptide repeat protein [bacterium]|nr:tetratricopeptide repeat protein [bacterium]
MKKGLLLGIIIILAAPFAVTASEADREMEKNWEAAMAAYKAAPSSQDTLERLNNFSLRWRNSHRYEAARAKYLRAMIYYKDRKYTAAYTEFKEVVDRFGNVTFADSAHYKMGECLYNQAKYSEAIEEWKKFRFKFSNSMFILEAVYGIALSHLNLKEYMKADRELTAFLDRNKFYADNEEIRTIGGIIDFYLGRYDASVEKLERLRSDVASYYQGHSLLKLTKWPDAANAFKRIVDLYKTSKYYESALYNKAEAFYKGTNYSAAAADYRAYLAAFPSGKLAPYARFKLGSSLFNDKKYDLAIAEFGKVSSEGPDKRVRGYARYFIGEANRVQKKYEQALASYNRVIEEHSDVYEVVSLAQVKGGWCHLVLGNASKSEVLLSGFTQKFAGHKDSALGYYLLGTSAYNKKDYPSALQAYKFLIDKFTYTDLTEAALLMTQLVYYNQQQYSMLISDASHILEVLSRKFEPPTSKIRARAYFYLGAAYYKSGMYGPAAKAFKEIVDKYYDSDIVTEARANLAWAYYELENYRGARTMARDVISSPKISREVKMACEILIAHSFFSERDYDRAAHEYGTFAYNYSKLKNNEVVAEALFQQGKVYEIQEYYNDAIKAWQALGGNFPNSKRTPEALYRISDIYFKAQQFDKALEGFQAIIARWPNDVIAEDAMLSIAEVYYNSEQEAKAEQAYAAFLKKYPDSNKIKSVEEGKERATYRKAEKKGDPEGLIGFADQYPNSPLAASALYQAGETYYQTSKFENAISTFNRLIKDFPGDTMSINAQYYIAACYEGLQRFDQAVASYKIFIRNHPRHDLAPDVTFRLATAAFTAKSYPDAVLYYERVVERYPGTEYAQNAAYNVALAYTELNKQDDAISSYKRFAKEYPEDPKSKDIPLQVAGMYLEQKRYRDALKEYTEIASAAKADVEKAEALYRAGEIYNTLEDKANAIAMFSKLMEAKPKDSIFRVTGLINLAALYESSQKWVEAVNVYKAITESGGQKEYVDGARSRMAEIRSVYPDLFKQASPAKDTKEK